MDDPRIPPKYGISLEISSGHNNKGPTTRAVSHACIQIPTLRLWYFGRGVNHEADDGSLVFGPEIWHGRRWKELSKTVPVDGDPMFLILWSDKADSPSGSLHPLVGTPGNISKDMRLKDGGMSTFGMLPRIEIRKPHGTGKAEGLGPEQKQIKAQLLADTYALLLAELESLAGEGTVFRFNGQAKRCYFRLLAFVCDKVSHPAIYSIRLLGAYLALHTALGGGA